MFDREAKKMNTIKEMLTVIIVLLFGLSLIGTVVDQTQAVNTTSWTFTGHEAAIALLGFIPFSWIIGLVLVVIGAALSATGKI